MTTARRWVHKLDGTDLNDAAHFTCSVPDARSQFGSDALVTEMQARTPVFNRQQPVAGRFTFLIANLDFLDGAQGVANLATLAALTGPGPHTYTCAAPGEDAAGRSVTVYFDGGLVVDTATGLCTAKAIAPDPTWS
jgi:hypothetical protein